MKSNNLYIAELKRINKKIACIRNEYDAVCEQWVKDKCPVKIGDTVTVNTFSYHGKQMKVTNVTVGRRWDGIYKWIVTGNVIRQSDGKPSKQQAESTYKVMED